MSAAEQARPTVLELARSYRDRGWRPFPLQHGTKNRPLVKWGTATQEPASDAQLEEWFGGEPRNIGIACGPSGLLVIDADTMTALAQAAADRNAAMPTTYTVRTAKGRHYYLTNPEREFGNSPGGLKVYGCDVRGGHGDGGYVLAAGSLHPDGVTYTVESDADVAEPFPWIKAILREDGPDATVTELPVSGVQNAQDGSRRFTEAQTKRFIREQILERLKAARPGQRNEELNACSMLLGHFVPEFMTQDVAEAWLLRNAPAGLVQEDGEAQCRKTIRSGLRAGMADWYAEKVPEVLADPEPGLDGVPEGGLEALARMRANQWATDRFARENGAQPVEPAFESVAALLARDIPGAKYRIEGLWPSKGKVLLTAPYKAGKTTLVGNLVRCLVDGDPFLGRPVFELGDQPGGFDVTPLADGRRVALLDFEMTDLALQEWLRDQEIRNPDRALVQLMRGQGWDPRDDVVRARWARVLREADVEILIIDPIAPVLHGLGIDENSNTEVGGLLTALDKLAAEAGVTEMLISHHTGHAGERARGAATFLGWPNAFWEMTVDEGRDGLRRGLSARGRDVDLAAAELLMDGSTRRQWLGGMSRAEARDAEGMDTVLGIVEENPLIPRRKLRDAVAEALAVGNEKADKIVTAAVRARVVHVHKGPNRSQLHQVGQRCEDCPLT